MVWDRHCKRDNVELVFDRNIGWTVYQMHCKTTQKRIGKIQGSMELDFVWRWGMSESKKLTIKQRWRKACTADNIVDFSVDVFLIVFDVLSSPILIVMRVVRWMLAKFVNEHVKNFIKKIVHWFIDNRKIRLQKGQNIFRYYWYLWLLSPAILLVLVLVLAFTTGVLEGLKEL